ncbi:hypothetical protein HGRIS_001362 [Hohenbuehelia grisea]|uniref:Uncharacterized protein n=1 Tax=Hohenbuehelia grisea TaxID=104357 RepID=A0ABR3JQN3_9AGAR
MHYVYTIPPTAVAAFLAAMWAWTDVEIKKMQPYIDLAKGDSPAQRSLLLDYNRHKWVSFYFSFHASFISSLYSNFTVWFHAWTNKHYLVFLTSAMVLLSLAFQPLAAALLVVKDTWWTKPDMTVNNLRTLGLNQNEEFFNLTTFVTAAGFASASVLYNLGEPPFVHQPYTIAPFGIPRNVIANGTIFANTTALKSDSGCRPITFNMERLADGSGWNNSVNSNGCTFTVSVDRNASTLFGTGTPTCTNQVPQQFAPVIFWFFTYNPTAMASGIICTPSFSLFDVAVTVDIATANLTSVTELKPFSSFSNFSETSANITGSPLNGRAYNGLQFDLGPSPSRFTLAKKAATQLQLPAAVYQAAVQAPEGLVGTFTADKFVQRSTQVYSTYLQLIAQEVYFVPNPQPLNIRVKTVVKRVYLSPVAVHLLTTAMLLLAIIAALLHLKHKRDRRGLRLGYEPGTIASAVAIGAETGVGQLLAGAKRESDMKAALASRSFRLDRDRGVIVMEGEPGYDLAESADMDDDKVGR